MLFNPVGIHGKLTTDTDDVARAPLRPTNAASFEHAYFPSISLEELGTLLADANPRESKERINENKGDLHRTSAKPSTTPAAPENLAKTTTITRETVAGNRSVTSGVDYTGREYFGTPLWAGATAEIPTGAGAGLLGTPSGVTGKGLFGSTAGATGAGGRTEGLFGNASATGAGARAGVLFGNPSASRTAGVTGAGNGISAAGGLFGSTRTIAAKSGTNSSAAVDPTPTFASLFGGVPAQKKPPNT